MNDSDDFHCFRMDPLLHWQAIAGVLETDPTAWDWALENIRRWLSHGRLHPAPLLEWRQILLESHHEPVKRQAFLQSLRLPPQTGHQDQMRSCLPFVGGPFRVITLPAAAS